MTNPVLYKQSIPAPRLLSHKKSYKLTNTMITDISMNEKTGVLAATTEDSRIILSNIKGSMDKDVLPISTVQINQDNIKRIEWIGYYEFATTGNNGSLNTFSMMNFSSEMYFIQKGNIATMKKYGDFIYTGSSDGTVNLWDFKDKSSIMSLDHVFKGRKQPIKDLEVYGSFLFSSTLYKGRIWAWDLRNPSLPLEITETDQSQNGLGFIEGNLYGCGRRGLLKISQQLNMMEYVYRNVDQQEYTINEIIFNERHRSIVFNDKDQIKMVCLDEDLKREDQNLLNSSVECKGILGIERFETDELIGYNENGSISIFSIS